MILVSVALLRGAVTGAVTGFFAGLIVDVATLGTLGLTALLLTLVGYWVGRYGETTGRARPARPDARDARRDGIRRARGLRRPVDAR